jgi:hypothetical protein
MFFEDNEQTNKQLLEDIKFKRRAVFNDDDSKGLVCEIKPFPKDLKKYLLQ